MSFSIAAITRRLLAPQHEISCSRRLWRGLLADLWHHGGRGLRESGAFLLGRRADGGRVRITEFVLYDDLDPHSLDTGIVRFDGRHFGRLWERCKERGLTVVADVHTHPDGAGQSESDRANPMIACPGHLALILPRFGRPPVHRAEIGMFQYLGAKRWETIPPGRRRTFLHLGI